MSNGGSGRPNLADWLRLQEMLAGRASSYFKGIGELVGQGAFEPREYIEQSAKAWAGVVGDFGSWLKQEPSPPGGHVVLAVSRGRAERAQATQQIDLNLPARLFEAADREDLEISLVTNGLVRRPISGQPPLVLEPGVHLAVSPEKAKSGDDVKLRIFDLQNIAEKGTFEGLIWATAVDGQKLEKPMPVGVVVLELA